MNIGEALKQYRTSEVLPERLILELMDQINKKIAIK